MKQNIMTNNQDFSDEKKKILDIQKARVHDIVHGAFIALKALIPNPIKASIRKAIRDQLNGRGTDSATVNQDVAMKSMKAVNSDGTQSKIDSLRQNIDKMCN